MYCYFHFFPRRGRAFGPKNLQHLLSNSTNSQLSLYPHLENTAVKLSAVLFTAILFGIVRKRSCMHRRLKTLFFDYQSVICSLELVGAPLYETDPTCLDMPPCFLSWQIVAGMG